MPLCTGSRLSRVMATHPREALRVHREAVLRLAQARGMRKVRVFGSVARGTAGPASDIDLLVEVGTDTSLLDMVALEHELSDLLGVRVQVVSEGGLKPWTRDHILREAVPV